MAADVHHIKSEPPLAKALNDVFTAPDSNKTAAIDKVYKMNEGRRNNLTGQSGNAVNAMLVAYDPFSNSSIISLKDRRKVIEYFGFEGGPDFEKDTIGRKMALSQAALTDGFKKRGFGQNARTVSVFLYTPEVRSLWKVESVETEYPVPPETVPQPPSNARPDTNGDIALFYMESQLEDFLIENWDKTELGQRYDLIEEEGELVSQQYRTQIGIIDILVQDKKSKQLVVIELKKNQTSDDTIGQLTRYMGWLEEHKTNGAPTKGIIIAAQHDTRLHYALKKVKDVEVYLYRVSFKLDEFKPAK
jgi:Endonuclease NucS